MNNEQLLELLKEVLEMDEISLDMELDGELWDSLAVVSFIATVSERYDIVYTAEKAIMANNVRDLLA